MKRLIFLVLSMLTLAPVCAAQVNVALLHQLVGQSESEHARQNDAKNKQLLVTSDEESNRTALSRLQSIYRTLADRFSALNLAIDAAQIGLQAAPIITEIVQQQSVILHQAARDPLLLSLAYGTQTDLADRARQLSNFLYGLLLSAGDLSQMKASDRRILFSHVLTELRSMAGASKGLALSMQYASKRKLLASANPFAGYIQTDKQLVDDILRNAASIKHY